MNLFQKKILDWYSLHKRDLPWRQNSDAYQIWLSEIILQQTRVAQGLPYYLKFTSNFPTIKDLAEASEQKVLQLWQGLGYYSRARNLHFTAKQISTSNNGVFPSSYKEILKLKGVGKYTAAAIASFAYNEKVAVLDGNVIRVLTRYNGIESDVSNTKVVEELRDLANSLLPDARHSDYNQGIMEFGALMCVPKNPNCDICPMIKNCSAFNTNKVLHIPVKLKKTKVRKRFFNYLVIKSKNSLLLRKRVEKDIWQSLFDFPLLEEKELLNFDDPKIIEHVKKVEPLNIISISSSNDFDHILSHQKIKARFFLVEVEKIPSQLKDNLLSIEIDSLDNYGKPILIQNYLNNYIF